MDTPRRSRYSNDDVSLAFLSWKGRWNAQDITIDTPLEILLTTPIDITQDTAAPFPTQPYMHNQGHAQ